MLAPLFLSAKAAEKISVGRIAAEKASRATGRSGRIFRGIQTAARSRRSRRIPSRASPAEMLYSHEPSVAMSQK